MGLWGSSDLRDLPWLPAAQESPSLLQPAISGEFQVIPHVLLKGLSVERHCPLLVSLGTATAATISRLPTRGEPAPASCDAVRGSPGVLTGLILQSF